MNIQAVSAVGYGANLTSVAQRSDGRTQAPAASSSETSREKVEISDTSSDMAVVRKAVDALPDVRLPIVNDINARIAISDYPIANNMNEALKQMLMSKVLSTS